MAEIYGHRWASAYGEESDAEGAAGTWAKGLAGVTPAQVATGLQACIASADPWPPTLPEFRARCLGVPSLAFVRDDVERKDRSPFTVLVWQMLDGYRYRQASADKADRMLRDAYELAREHVMRGGALPEPAAGALTHEAPAPIKPAAPEVAQSAIAEARAMLRREPVPESEPDAVPRVDLSALERELRTHYDAKVAAAGPDA